MAVFASAETARIGFEVKKTLTIGELRGSCPWNETDEEIAHSMEELR